MKVAVIGKKTLLHDRLGALPPGWSGEMDERSAQRYLTQGVVERYETKVVREVPLQDAGAVEPLSASPVAQVSAEPTAKPSENGAKKRGRPRKASSQ